MLSSLFGRHALRGSIEVSTGILLESGEVYGPVLNRAYLLERDVAGYPRIVIGQGTLDYLRAHSQTEPKDIFQRHCKVFADLCLGLVAVDSDGVPILDYLGKNFRDFVGKDSIPDDPKVPTLQAAIQGAFDFVRSERERHWARQDMKLFQRYRQLEAYFRARMQ